MYNDISTSPFTIVILGFFIAYVLSNYGDKNGPDKGSGGASPSGV